MVISTNNTSKNYNIMEKYQPDEKKIASIRAQYYGLKFNLDEYRKGFRSKEFKYEFSDKQKNDTKYQYGFLKRTIRSSVRFLITYNGADKELLKDAFFCRYIDMGTRWIILKHISKQPLFEWL